MTTLPKFLTRYRQIGTFALCLAFGSAVWYFGLWALFNLFGEK